MKIVASIQVRMGSSRFPGKVMHETSGKPLLGHLLSRLKRSKLLDDIVVATSVNPENDVIESYGNTKTKLYWHADGLHECHDKFNQDPKYKELIQKAIDSRVIVVGHTDYDLEILSQMGLEKNQYEQIPPLLDNKLISKKKNWSNPRLLSLARFFDYKRHEDVFDATKQVDKNLEVILAGSSDSEYSLGIITRLNEKGASLILNPSSLMVNDLYNLATHFVLASNKETLGIAALEATVSGCIPLVKRNKGIISYLPEQFIFDNLIELKEKLSYSINPEVSKILASELKELRIKLSLENIKLEFEKSYRRRI